jgi:MerR family transcriptional regulator, copper efflux regulator
MQIGQLAQAAGVAVDTVRYYEKQGLLPAPPRRGAYRAYAREDVQRLRFIRRAKALGFTLEEIAGLLQLSAHRNDDMGAVRQAAQARLQEIEQRIAELERVRAGLRQVLDACPGHGALADCPILASLAGEEG